MPYRTAGDASSDGQAAKGRTNGNDALAPGIEPSSLRRQSDLDAPDSDSVPLSAFRRVPTQPGGKLLPSHYSAACQDATIHIGYLKHLEWMNHTRW